MTVNTSNGLGENGEIQQICDCRDILHHGLVDQFTSVTQRYSRKDEHYQGATFQKRPLIAAILSRGAYSRYVSTVKRPTPRWRLFQQSHHARKIYGQMSQTTETARAFLFSQCLKVTRVIADKLNETAKYYRGQ